MVRSPPISPRAADKGRAGAGESKVARCCPCADACVCPLVHRVRSRGSVSRKWHHRVRTPFRGAVSAERARTLSRPGRASSLRWAHGQYSLVGSLASRRGLRRPRGGQFFSPRHQECLCDGGQPNTHGVRPGCRWGPRSPEVTPVCGSEARRDHRLVVWCRGCPHRGARVVRVAIPSRAEWLPSRRRLLPALSPHRRRHQHSPLVALGRGR